MNEQILCFVVFDWQKKHRYLHLLGHVVWLHDSKNQVLWDNHFCWSNLDWQSCSWSIFVSFLWKSKKWNKICLWSEWSLEIIKDLKWTSQEHGHSSSSTIWSLFCCSIISLSTKSTTIKYFWWVATFFPFFGLFSSVFVTTQLCFFYFVLNLCFFIFCFEFVFLNFFWLSHLNLFDYHIWICLFDFAKTKQQQQQPNNSTGGGSRIVVNIEEQSQKTITDETVLLFPALLDQKRPDDLMQNVIQSSNSSKVRGRRVSVKNNKLDPSWVWSRRTLERSDCSWWWQWREIYCWVECWRKFDWYDCFCDCWLSSKPWSSTGWNFGKGVVNVAIYFCFVFLFVLCVGDFVFHFFCSTHWLIVCFVVFLVACCFWISHTGCQDCERPNQCRHNWDSTESQRFVDWQGWKRSSWVQSGKTWPTQKNHQLVTAVRMGGGDKTRMQENTIGVFGLLCPTSFNFSGLFYQIWLWQYFIISLITSKQATTTGASEEYEEQEPEERVAPPLSHKRSHAFLSHDWQTDKNHERVSRINTQLHKLGIKTWFDEDCMQGDIDERMAAGIAQSVVVVVFVTRCYLDKVSGKNKADNCRKEFHLATETQTANCMPVAVMESEARHLKKWSGVFKLHLAKQFSIDMTNDANMEKNVNRLFDDLSNAWKEFVVSLISHKQLLFCLMAFFCLFLCLFLPVCMVPKRQTTNKMKQKCVCGTCVSLEVVRWRWCLEPWQLWLKKQKLNHNSTLLFVVWFDSVKKERKGLFKELANKWNCQNGVKHNFLFPIQRKWITKLRD